MTYTAILYYFGQNIFSDLWHRKWDKHIMRAVQSEWKLTLSKVYFLFKNGVLKKSLVLFRPATILEISQFNDDSLCWEDFTVIYSLVYIITYASA